MDCTASRKVYALGQSLWYDNISRTILEDGTLEELIRQGAIYGVTTNPSIFAKAIPESAYDPAVAELAPRGFDTRRIYDMLTVEDVRRAADLFRDLYEASRFTDGYVSIEVSPELAHDTEGTIRDAKRLAAFVDRPNVMFKIPGTPEGVPAIEELTAAGYNVNVTLLFDVTQYEAAAKAYLRGIARFIESGGDPRRVCSVASVFVSRIDTAVDRLLDEMGAPEAAALRGKAGVAVMKEVYARFRELFGTAEFGALKARGAGLQRVLWASTSTKDPAYSPTKYVDSLIAPDTVNTLPPKTLHAFLEKGDAELAFCSAPDYSELDALAALGVDVRAVCARLQADGITAFQRSFEEVLGVLEARRKKFAEGR